MKEIEIEFLEWVHPQLGVTAVKVEGDKPLVLKARIKEALAQRTWVGLTDEEINEVFGADIRDEPSGELRFIRAIEAKLKEKNT